MKSRRLLPLIGGLSCGLLKVFLLQVKTLGEGLSVVAVFQVVYHQCYSFWEKVYLWWSGLFFDLMSLQREGGQRVLPVP